MSKDFYPDLKVLEDNLFIPEKVSEFIANYGLRSIIENATSATNEKSKNRLRDLFKRISTSEHFGSIISMLNSTDENQVKLINKFMKSQNSEMLFEYFQNYSEPLVVLISKQPKYVSILLGLIEHSSGLKVLKTFQKIYKNHQNLETIYSEQARQQLSKGIQNEDSTVAMRYIELAVNIATYSQKGFTFILNGKMLQEALNHYDTQDTLLKLNVVEVIEMFGNSLLTAEFLKKSTIWQKIVAQAFNVDEQFYIKKSLIVLIAKMSSQNCFEITPLAAKNFTVFLKEMLTSKLVDEIDAGLDVISYLGKTVAGLQVIVNSEQITQHYVTISRATGENTKLKYIYSLDSIVDRKSQNKSHATIVTLLSCIGDVTLAKSYNLKGSHPVLSGLPKFAEWFYSVLNLPFEQLKLATIEFYRQLLEYKQVCVELFGVKQAMQFFKRKLHRYDLIAAKKILIEQILRHGETNWKGHQLQVFTNLLRTQMIQGQSNEVEYAVQAK